MLVRLLPEDIPVKFILDTVSEIHSNCKNYTEWHNNLTFDWGHRVKVNNETGDIMLDFNNVNITNIKVCMRSLKSLTLKTLKHAFDHQTMYM